MATIPVYQLHFFFKKKDGEFIDNDWTYNEVPVVPNIRDIVFFESYYSEHTSELFKKKCLELYSNFNTFHYEVTLRKHILKTWYAVDEWDTEYHYNIYLKPFYGFKEEDEQFLKFFKL
jgi:hypothetical protein